MARRSKTPSWLVPGIIVSSVIALWANSASASQVTMSNGATQTSTVGGRTYTITKLGSGNYTVNLVSTNGVIETSPTSYTFSQTGQLGAMGDPAKLAQLKTDMQSFKVNFAT